MRRLSVAYVNLAFAPASTGRAMLARLQTSRRFCEALATVPGLDVTLLSRSSQDEDLDFAGVRAYLRKDGGPPPAPRFWNVPVALLRLLRDLEPDVIHFNGFIFPLPAAEVAAVLKPGAVLVLQHHGEPVPSGLRRMRQRFGTLLADAALFTCAEMATPWIEAGIFRKDTLVQEVLEASSDFAPLPREYARQKSGLSGRPAVLWVGRLHERKDPVTAVRGFQKVLESLPQARLCMIFQDSTLLPGIERILASDPKLAAAVELLGRVEHGDLPEYFSASDLFLTSSPAEGSNYALIESLACGLFPVASDIPAHRFLTEGGSHGALFPARDPDGCAAAILAAWERCSKEPDVAGELRRHFASRLGWNSIAKSAAAAYRAVLSRRLGDER